MGSEGRSRVTPKNVAPGRRDAGSYQRSSEEVRERQARTSKGRHLARICPACAVKGARRVHVAERLRRSAEAGRTSDTMAGALGRSSIFSCRPSGLPRGRWLLHAGRRWDDSGLSVNRTSCAREQHAGEELAVGAGTDHWCRETTAGVRGRDASREGSTSADMKRGRAKGQHP
jgi:hypothetical protein